MSYYGVSTKFFLKKYFAFVKRILTLQYKVLLIIKSTWKKVKH